MCGARLSPTDAWQETTLQPLNPREIQSRVRAGESPESIAAQTGWPLEKVARYAEPPLGERAHIVQLAQGVELRRSGSAASLLDVVAEVVSGAGISLGDIAWDSRRRDDGKWTVTAVADTAGEAIDAEWTYDHSGRNLHPVNTDACRLMGITPPPVAAEPDFIVDEPVTRAEPAPEQRPHLVAVPTQPADEESEAADEVPSSAAASQPTITIPVDIPAEQPPAAKPKPKPRGKGRRASVPSWDEILFGTQQHDSE